MHRGRPAGRKYILPSNRVHLTQITTQDTAGHPWPTSLLSSPDLSDLRDDASRLAPPLMAHQPTAGSPFPYSPWDPPPLCRPCSRRLTSRRLSLTHFLSTSLPHLGTHNKHKSRNHLHRTNSQRGNTTRITTCRTRTIRLGGWVGLLGRQRNCQPKSRNRIRERRQRQFLGGISDCLLT